MLIFTHIPKTGGTTVNLNFLAGTRPKDEIRIEGNYKKEEIHTFQTGARRSPDLDWPPISFDVLCSDIINLIKFLDSPEISKIKLIKGHLPYGVHNYIVDDCYYFTVLREPVARVWSVYNGVLIDEKHYLHDIWKNKYHWDLKQILKDHPPELCNDQFRMMLGTSNTSFSSFVMKQIPEIVNNYSFVTTSDHVSEIGTKFGYLFKWKHLMLKKSFNVESYNKLNEKPSTELAKIILDCNQYDLKLYEYVNQCGTVFNMRAGEPFNVD